MNAGRMPMPRPPASWRGERSWLLTAPPDGSWGQTPQAPGSLLREQAALWEAHGSPAGLLLRDEALAEAERWASGHPEALTEAEGDFIRECREAARGAQRELARQGLLRGAITLAVIGLLLALCAWRAAQQRGADLSAAQAAAQARLAETAEVAEAWAAAAESSAQARDEAAGEAHASKRGLLVERALKLAAQSQAALFEDRDLALLLAVEAGRALPPLEPLAADQLSAVLYRALGHPGWQAWLEPADGGEPRRHRPAWTAPDGRLLSPTAEGGLAIWDAAAGAQQLMLQGDVQVALAAWSHDGSRVAGVTAGGVVALWDATSGARLWSVPAWASCDDLSWSLDDTEVLLDGGNDTVIGLDAATGIAGALRPAPTPWPGQHETWRDAPLLAWTPAGGGLPMLADLDATVDLACARAARNLSAAEWARYLGAEAPYRETCPGVAP